MKRTLNKDTFREIKKSFGRFLSIFAIVAIGVAFFAGVKSAAPDMKFTADKYFDDNNLMDIRVLSDLGLTDNDVAAIKNSDGVLGVYPTHSIDALIKDGTSQSVFKVSGMPLQDLDDTNEEYINRPTLVEGRLPEKSGECVIEKTLMPGLNLNIGDTLTLNSGTDEDILENLNTKEYTIVGTVLTSYYLSFEKGTSSIGNGKVDSFVIIPETDFNMDVYTEVLVTVSGAKAINSYDDEYFDITDLSVDSLESLGTIMGPIRLQEIKDEANKKLQEGKDEYNINKLKFDEEIEKAFNRIEDGKNEIIVGENNLDSKEKEFNLLMKNSESKLNEGAVKLASGRAEYEKNLAVLNESKLGLSQLEEAVKNPLLPAESKAQLEAQLSEGQAQFALGEAKLNSAKAMLDSSSKELETQKAALIAGKAQGKKDIAAGRQKIASAKTEMVAGEEEYNKSKTEGEEALATASDKITKGEDEIAELEEPTWYVLDRTSHYSYVDYGGSADRIAAIAKVFPVFFFLVAALVCLTTMTRMVDEQRSTIGTLKALGYSKVKIASKYVIYAAIASILGSIAGFCIGMVVFPTVIFNAYGIMYTLPNLIIKFDIYLALSTTALILLITTSATLFACYKELMETPSLLMRPKAPKNGKRIFLERLNFIWKRLSFTEKLTARNIFRYKKRFFMTVIGISGCTALIIAGFGIKDSIESIVKVQFGEIITHDLSVSLDKKSTLEEKQSILNKYKEDSRIDSIMSSSEYNGNITVPDEEKPITLEVPSDTEEYKDFLIFRTRGSHKEVLLENNGALLSEKLARDLNVKVGDTILIDNGDSDKKEILITGITETYLGHHVYMSEDYYKEVFEEEPLYNNLIAKLNDSSKDVEDTLGADIVNENIVKSLNFYTGTIDSFNDTVSSLNFVVIVLIVSAGALAFVVLYNLTNVNISERLREIATIKVLGFYDKEVSAYVYRENIILTIIGSLVGLGLGTALHRFIMITVELESVMFGRNISLVSYISAFGITVAFAVFVNLAMYYKLKNIPMVESLKSVE